MKKLALCFSMSLLAPVASAEYIKYDQETARQIYREQSQQAATLARERYERGKEAARVQTEINIQNWRVQQEAREANRRAMIESSRPSSYGSTSYSSSGSRSYSSSPYPGSLYDGTNPYHPGQSYPGTNYPSNSDVIEEIHLPDGRVIRRLPGQSIDSILNSSSSSSRRSSPILNMRPAKLEETGPVLSAILPQYQSAIRADAAAWKQRWIEGWIALIDQSIADRDAKIASEPNEAIRNLAMERYRPLREAFTAARDDYASKITTELSRWNDLAETDLKPALERALDDERPQTKAREVASELWRRALNKREGLQTEISSSWSAEGGLLARWNAFDTDAILAELHAQRDPLDKLEKELIAQETALYNQTVGDKLSWVTNETEATRNWRKVYEQALTGDSKVPLHIQRAASKRYQGELVRRLQSLRSANELQKKAELARTETQQSIRARIAQALSEKTPVDKVRKEMETKLGATYRALEPEVARTFQAYHEGPDAEIARQKKFPPADELIAGEQNRFRHILVEGSPFFFDLGIDSGAMFFMGSHLVEGRRSFANHEDTAVLIAERVAPLNYADNGPELDVAEPQASGWAVFFEGDRIVGRTKAPENASIDRVEYLPEAGLFFISFKGVKGQLLPEGVSVSPENWSMQPQKVPALKKTKEIWD